MERVIQVKTEIKATDLKKVFYAFDEALFDYLTKKATLKKIKYEGNQLGDEIHLQMTLPWKSIWITKITEINFTDTECYFVDEGSVLPFGLTTWKHKHIIRKKSSTQLEIEDLITLNTNNKLLTMLYYYVFKFQFKGRRKDYKTYLKGQ